MAEEQSQQSASTDDGAKAVEPADDSGRAGGDDRLKADLVGERKARQAAESKLEEMQKQLDELHEAQKSESEKAVDNARKEGKSEADKAWGLRIVRTDVKAAAREKFADPADALAFLDLTKFKVDSDGETDEKAIAAALDKLLEEKPHLAKTTRTGPGSADGGARGRATKGVDMNDLLRQAARR